MHIHTTQHGLALIKDISAKKGGRAVNILTHCNAGWLAFVDNGSATAPIYAAHDCGIKVRTCIHRCGHIYIYTRTFILDIYTYIHVPLYTYVIVYGWNAHRIAGWLAFLSDRYATAPIYAAHDCSIKV